MSKQRSTAFQRSSAFYEVSQAASSRLESAAADDEKRRKRLEQKQVEAWRSFVLGRSILSVLAVVLFAFALILIFRLLASSISQEILEVEEERVEREQVFDGSDAAELDTNLPELARSVCSGNIVRKYRSFENIVRKASEVFVRELSSALWMNGKGFNSSIFEAHAASGKAQFIPFVQRKVVAEGSNIVVWGDLHGSSCSLLLALLHQRRAAAGVGDNSARSGSHGACILDDALTLRSDCYFIFLGDTIDRGRHSIEVLYIILTLKLRNPSNVILIRGNHEEERMSARYGFRQEIWSKYHLPYQRPLLSPVFQFFHLLPAAAYLAVDREDRKLAWVQFSHGSWELGFNPKSFLSSDPSFTHCYITMIERQYVLQQMFQKPLSVADHSVESLKQRLKSQVSQDPELSATFQSESPIQPYTFGLMWHDLAIGQPEDIVHVVGRGIAYNSELLSLLLEMASTEGHSVMRGIVRGHQHNNAVGPLLDALREHKGYVDMREHKLWPLLTGIFVCNILSAPESGLGFSYDSYALFEVGQTVWKATHYWKQHELQSLHPTLSTEFSKTSFTYVVSVDTPP